MDLIDVLTIFALIALLIVSYDIVKEFGKKELYDMYYYCIIVAMIALVPFYLISLIYPEINFWIHFGLGLLGLTIIFLVFEKINFPQKFWKIREELKGNV